MADMTGYSIVPVDPVEDDGGPEPGGQASGRSVAAAGLEQAATDETLARGMARRPASHPADKNSDWPALLAAPIPGRRRVRDQQH
jgi:hypothetical protein